MSILSMPTFSSGPISYCVIMESSPPAAAPDPLVGAVHTGMLSMSNTSCHFCRSTAAQLDGALLHRAARLDRARLLEASLHRATARNAR